MGNYIKKHREQLRKNAAECCVLLKSDGSFPISKPCKIALYGSGARNTVKGGTGSGNVYSEDFATCESGLKEAGFEITTGNWLDAYEHEKERTRSEFYNAIRQKAKDMGVSPFLVGFGKVEPEHDYKIPLEGDGEIAVYVLARVSGEGNDLTPTAGDVMLTQTEINDILTLSAQYKKFMLVLNVGRYVDLLPVINVQNILLLSQLGVVTGNILADILLGEATPSGKLTATWAKFEDYCPYGDFGDINDTRYKEGVFVGYRYFDSVNVRPLFPFGFGLSYTRFDITPQKTVGKNGKVSVNVAVKNIGAYSGKEVVQLYVSPPKGQIIKPYQSLVAFAKTNLLQTGECQSLSLQFNMAEIASFVEVSGKYVLEEGNYILRIGCDSRNTTVIGAVCLKESITVKQVKKGLLGNTDFSDFIPESVDSEDDVKPIVTFSANDFMVQNPVYDVARRVDKDLLEFTDEELVRLCIGAYKDGTETSVIGNAALHVGGAAGETTNRLQEKLNGKYIVMADGPAGLRLAPQVTEDENGVHAIYEILPDGLNELMPDEINAAVEQRYNATPKDKIKRQPTTAIPIGTAIAQSWNEDFAKLCGDIVGREMEIFGIGLWLAPAMNIQRSVLCGRNFEYFSEDPLLSGKMAAAITQGVQSHKNRGVTVKHFAANNQETNRYNNNSIVSERALREIYLKGFEICIRESEPFAVMTSYNLVNGVHTSESRGLLENVLRDEFGFHGFVMSDWITSGRTYNRQSKHPAAYTSNLIKAGNDITMAGSSADYDDAMQAIKEGRLKREDLLICASRIYQALQK